jgi:hypothetical protein
MDQPIESKKAWRDRALRVPRAVPHPRGRGMQRRRGSRIAEHLKLVLSVMDRQGH